MLMPSDSVYVCSRCGSFFATQEDFDFRHKQKGHRDAAKLKPLFAAELEGTDKALAFFELSRGSWKSDPSPRKI